MLLKIGRRSKHEVKNIAEAVQIFEQARSSSYEGASTFPDGKVVDGKRSVTISYNGCVWLSQGNEIRQGCELYTSTSL